MTIHPRAGWARAGAVLLWATAGAWCAQVSAEAPAVTYEPIVEARVEAIEGAPRLLINGTPTPPLIFFGNADIPGDLAKAFMREQATFAARAGVHLFSFPVRIGRAPDGAPDYSHGETTMSMLSHADPHARFLLRLYPGPWPHWPEWKELPEGHRAVYADGTQGGISLASDYFWEPSNRDLEATIRHYESGEFGPRIIGYHVGGPDSENFLENYREKGPDYSPVNEARFRRWLRERYGTDDGLRQAWRRADVTLDTAPLPTSAPERFPMHGSRPGETVRMFYDIPDQRDWVDFGAYCSDLVSDRLLNWARLIKSTTAGRKLSVFFYGYTFELCGSFSGHDALEKVLRCPDIDILAGPISYMDRMGGGPGGFMAPVDSITAHGKLWINEDDTRTHLLEPSRLPSGVQLWQGEKADHPQETIGVLDRNLAAAVVHRTGVWWMDLMGAGAFASTDMWHLMAKRMTLFVENVDTPVPYRPDVAVVVDEKVKTLVASDWDGHYQTLMGFRNEIMRSGAAVGYYLLSDFMEGRVPQCKLYVFPNAFRHEGQLKAVIRSRLAREGATAVWLYVPGWMRQDGLHPEGGVQLTGIAVERRDGVMGSTGESLLQGLEWGWSAQVAPRPVIRDEAAEILGRYRADNLPSAARVHRDNAWHYVLGDLGANASVMRTVFREAGVHIWTAGDEIVHTDGHVLVIHSGRGGDVPVAVPEGVRVEALDGADGATDARPCVLRMAPDSTAWLRLSRNTTARR